MVHRPYRPSSMVHRPYPSIVRIVRIPMASEKQIKRVLDLFTGAAPPSAARALRVGARSHVRSMRKLMRSENIVAVGISEKISRRKRTGKLALTFYVERKVPLEELSADMVVPVAIAESLSGPTAIPTDVVPLGKMWPEIKAVRKPIQPGFSIGHVNATAGTIGAIVTKKKEFYILSNSHVLALAGEAQKGDDIIYPGDADGGTAPDDVIAELTDFVEFETGGDFVNRVDCAIAKPTAARLADISSDIKGIGPPKGTIKPKRGMKVVKVGRTTGKTHGEIRDVNFRFVLDFQGDVGEVGFLDQVLCTRYTQAGDSGSLVIERSTGRAVGLHFAGADGGSVFCPIDEVLKALRVKLVTKSIPKATKKKSGTAVKRSPARKKR